MLYVWPLITRSEIKRKEIDILFDSQGASTDLLSSGLLITTAHEFAETLLSMIATSTPALPRRDLIMKQTSYYLRILQKHDICSNELKPSEKAATALKCALTHYTAMRFV